MKKIIFLLVFFNSSSIYADPVVESNANVSIEIYWLWVAICCVLVFLMQAGFLLLESGMVRSKNAINVIMKNFTDISFGILGFWAFGYGLMFGVNNTGWIGTSDFLTSFSNTSDSINLLYQMMFAATAATIVSGAVAERFSFIHYLVGAFLITTIIYPIFGSWAWGGSVESPGWLRGLGFHDAAGATVVHSIGAWSALGALIIIGPRYGRYSRKGKLHDIPGHNLPYVALGGFILWFGWFGFNGGSVSDDFSNLGQILLNTQLGAVGGVAGAIFWMLVTKQGLKMTHTVNGALAGLVSITAGVDVFSPLVSILTGLAGGILLVVTTDFLNHWKVDDVVGAIPVHGFCGAWGTFAVGLFYQGDMFNIERIIAQTVGIVAAFVWALSIAYLLYFIMNKVTKGIRVSTKFEQRGLDVSEHEEIGYSDFMTTQVNESIKE